MRGARFRPRRTAGGQVLPGGVGGAGGPRRRGGEERLRQPSQTDRPTDLSPARLRRPLAAGPVLTPAAARSPAAKRPGPGEEEEEEGGGGGAGAGAGGAAAAAAAMVPLPARRALLAAAVGAAGRRRVPSHRGNGRLRSFPPPHPGTASRPAEPFLSPQLRRRRRRRGGPPRARGARRRSPAGPPPCCGTCYSSCGPPGR